jgi:S1-C subfamily serine protease
VTLVAQDGTRHEADVVGVDHGRDVARLESSLAPVPLQAVAGLPRPGDDVLAIGAPEGLSGTVTRGIVSANRDVDGQQLIQTDVAVNPGNSGGPLLTGTGLVVGVTSSKAVGEEGIAFAIPIQDAARAAAAAPAPQGGGIGGHGTTWAIGGGLFAALLGALSLVLARRRRAAAQSLVRLRPSAPRPSQDEPLVLIRRRRNRAPEPAPEVVVHTKRSENEWT